MSHKTKEYRPDPYGSPMVVDPKMIRDAVVALDAVMSELGMWHPSCAKAGCTVRPCSTVEAQELAIASMKRLDEMLRERGIRM